MRMLSDDGAFAKAVPIGYWHETSWDNENPTVYKVTLNSDGLLELVSDDSVFVIEAKRLGNGFYLVQVTDNKGSDYNLFLAKINEDRRSLVSYYIAYDCKNKLDLYKKFFHKYALGINNSCEIVSGSSENFIVAIKAMVAAPDEYGVKPMDKYTLLNNRDGSMLYSAYQTMRRGEWCCQSKK